MKHEEEKEEEKPEHSPSLVEAETEAAAAVEVLLAFVVDSDFVVDCVSVLAAERRHRKKPNQQNR